MTGLNEQAFWRIQGALAVTDDSDVWRPVLDVFVPGRPVPQGSIRATISRTTGRALAVKANQGPQEAWRAAVVAAVLPVWRPRPPLTVAVRAHLDFTMPRPKALSARRPTPNMIKAPDVDKIIRNVLDALSDAGVWRDDAQVVDVHATKNTAAPGEQAGCSIQLDEARGTSR